MKRRLGPEPVPQPIGARPTLSNRKVVRARFLVLPLRAFIGFIPAAPPVFSRKRKESVLFFTIPQSRPEIKHPA